MEGELRLGVRGCIRVKAGGEGVSVKAGGEGVRG